MGKYNRYDDEFKQNLVNLYQSGKTQTDIAKVSTYPGVHFFIFTPSLHSAIIMLVSPT
ncbi:transposase [Lactiplantibacillus plantarum]|nr:transposase [Lactiplantibacillus plantarum]